MDPFEQMFRYAWNLDFGESPEQTVDRVKRKANETLTPSMLQCRLRESHFMMSARQMLNQFRGAVTQEATNHNIDGRAIAGAIAWEYEQNWTGRFSDYLQVPFGGGKSAGIGWGSIHTPEVQKLRPGASNKDLLCQRMEARPAIKLVAEFMDNMATLYYQESNGVWIRDCPAALAFFFNTGEKTARRSANARQNDPNRANGSVALDVSPNAMGSWVHRKLSQFKSYKTNPVRPSNVVGVTIGKWAVPPPPPSVDWSRKICCFPSGTLVHTVSGRRCIESLKPGEAVWAFDPESNQIARRPVLRLENHDGQFAIHELRHRTGVLASATSGHHFAQIDTGWAPTESLAQDARLTTCEGDVRLERVVSRRSVCRRVYNLRVAEDHNYFVGTKGLLVRDW